MISLNDVLLAMSNVPVSDPIAEIWGRGLQGGYKIIEYTGTLPITITADGTALIDYCIYGDAVQDGTPTPENHIMLTGCGERTENMFDPDNTSGIKDGYYIDRTTGNKVSALSYYISAPMSVIGNETYTWLFNFPSSGAAHSAPTVGFYDSNDNQIGVAAHDSSVRNFTFTVPSDCTYIKASVYKVDKYRSMLTPSSTAPTEYIPYGYKLPLTVNGVEYPIYIGEAETTRRIRKLVLTGEEDWQKSSGGYNAFYFYMDAHHMYPYHKKENSALICNIATYTTRLYDYANYPWYCVSDNTFGISTDSTVVGGTTVNEFKSWLAAQYAAGTPVTVWYILEETKTAVVNEPLMKIGNYADTIDSTQAAAQIPTFAGTTVIDYDGEPKPSQMYIKYRR